MIAIYVIVGLVLVALVGIAMSARIIRQYERVVLFEDNGSIDSGRARPSVRA